MALAMYKVCLLFTLWAFARAQIPSFGFCPDYVPMAHFDMNRFFGKWYESERYFQFSEVASRCVVTDYAKAPNGKIYVSNEVTNRLTGIKRVIEGNVEITGKRHEGKFTVKHQTTPVSTTSTMYVLGTDYDNYAVIWNCNGLGPVNAQSVWIMTRERLADPPVLQEAYGVLDRYKISRNFFVKTDQEGCAIAASDLNAALGITSISTNNEQIDEDERKYVKSNVVSDVEASRSTAEEVPEVLLRVSGENKDAESKKCNEDQKNDEKNNETTPSDVKQE